MRKLTTKEFTSKANKVHQNKYCYSKFEYINNSTKSIIICPIHGEFYKNANKHLLGQGCPKCSRLFKLTNNIFIQRSKIIHNNKYDYSKVKYKNSKTKVCIICPEHGEFWQNPNDHMTNHGCSDCGKNKTIKKLKLDLNNFINISNKIHNNKYDYSKVKYINNKTKVCIICPKHGDFSQNPHNHMQNHGCPKCQQSKGELEVERWLIKHNINFIPQKKFNGCCGVRRELPFDFYLPDHNLCIEFDGQQHYTGTFNGKPVINNDQIKTQYCKENQILLIRIPYWDIDNIDNILSKEIYQSNSSSSKIYPKVSSSSFKSSKSILRR